jgi:hypothetical protein
VDKVADSLRIIIPLYPGAGAMDTFGHLGTALSTDKNKNITCGGRVAATSDSYS